jgi:hypothetical protein
VKISETSARRGTAAISEIIPRFGERQDVRIQIE